MLIRRFDSANLNEVLAGAVPAKCADKDVGMAVVARTEELLKLIRSGGIDWQSFRSFWPPRLVAAYREGHLVPFFGAGVSFGAGLPSWDELLGRLGIDDALLGDPDLSGDALTMAELSSQQLGANEVQRIIRKSLESADRPTASHMLVASLRCPVNITTNYDDLFEKAWQVVNPGIHLEVAVNDTDIVTKDARLVNYEIIGPNASCTKAILLKIHGSVDRVDEHLILTRKDYRHHYRTNTRFFDLVKEVLGKRHTLFLGFSHRDPEVTRLVDDAIYRFEREQQSSYSRLGAERPHFYSLQFDMRLHTPEIFAARGLVALKPPIIEDTSLNARSAALSISTAELIIAADKDTHRSLGMDGCLHTMATQIETDLSDALSAIGSHRGNALEVLNRTGDDSWLGELLHSLGSLAGQGVYLLDDQGTIVRLEVPVGLDKDARLKASSGSFSSRPYFRQAKTFREPFVADTLRSVFNGLSTIFPCVPLHDDDNVFRGLLFSAAQIGAWDTPITCAKGFWDEKGEFSVLLLDGNGIAMLPSDNQFAVESNEGVDGREDPQSNTGYPQDKLVALSRRDSLLSHISRNVIPLAQDDDIYSPSVDLKYYSVLTEIQGTRWKVGISRRIMSTSV